MKHFFCSIAVLMAFAIAKGQILEQGVDFLVSNDPIEFLVVEQVTIRITMSTDLQSTWQTEDLYLWMWVEGGGDSPTNGMWGNSNEKQKMNKVKNGIYEFTFMPAGWFGISPGSIHEMGMLIKAKNGFPATGSSQERKSDNFFIEVKAAEFVDRLGRVFPSNLGNDDVMTIYFNQELLDDVLQRNYMGEVNIYLIPNEDIAKAKVYSMGVIATVPYRQSAITFVPSEMFPNEQLTKLRYYFELTETGETITFDLLQTPFEQVFINFKI